MKKSPFNLQRKVILTRHLILVFLYLLVGFSAKAQCPSIVITTPASTNIFAGEVVLLECTELSATKYQWYKDGVIIADSISRTCYTNEAGNYTVTTDICILPSIPVKVTINQPACKVIASITNQINVICSGSNTGSVTVTGSGGVAPYQYNINGGVFQASGTFNNLAGGKYNIILKDANNCAVTLPFTITAPASSLAATITSQTNILCAGQGYGNATVTASGGTAPYTYSWNSVPVQTTPTFVNLTAGTYIVTVKDASGCTVTASVTITQPTPIVVTLSNTNVACFGDATGTATAITSGGVPPYTYSWLTTPLQTTVTATNLPAGSYTMAVFDASGCYKSAFTTITQPATKLTASITNQVNVDDVESNNGSIAVFGSGGIAPIQYNINGGTFQASGTFNNLAEGIYTIIARDANNCTSNLTATITNISGNPTADLKSGLVAYYPFNGNANDVSGNNNNGTVNGVTLTTDRFNKANSAYNFAGVTDPQTIMVPNSATLQFTDAASFSFWINMNDYQGIDGWGSNVADGHHVLFAKDFDRCCIVGAVQGLPNGEFSAGIGTGWNATGAGDTVPNSSIHQWVNITYILTTTSVSIYANGNLIGSKTGPVSFESSNTKNLWFGRLSEFWYPFNGKMDDISIYNRALNIAEIKSLYQETDTIIIAVASNPTIGGNTSGGGTYSLGSPATVKAIPGKNWIFVFWSENGKLVSTNAEYSFNVTASRNLIANFVLLQSSIITSANPAAGGSTFGDGVYEYESLATVYVTPNDGYSFLNWTENGTVVHNTTDYTFLATANRNLVANFLATVEIDEQFKSGISVYPNPVKEKLFISFDKAICPKTLDIRITNSLGKLVYTYELENAQENTDLDVHGFKSGIYNLLISDKETKRAAGFKIVVKH